MLRGTLQDFRANRATIFTYNYDRSPEDFLLRALRAKYRHKAREEYAQALDCVGPWHLYGRLGCLRDLPVNQLATFCTAARRTSG